MPSADADGNRDVGFPSAGEDTRPSFQRGHCESFVSPPRKGIVTKSYKSGSFALSLVACPDFRILLSAQTRQCNHGRGLALGVFHEQKNGSLGSIYKDVTNFTQIQDLESPTN
jgi:hypothetical protein